MVAVKQPQIHNVAIKAHTEVILCANNKGNKMLYFPNPYLWQRSPFWGLVSIEWCKKSAFPIDAYTLPLQWCTGNWTCSLPDNTMCFWGSKKFTNVSCHGSTMCTIRISTGRHLDLHEIGIWCARMQLKDRMQTSDLSFCYFENPRCQTSQYIKMLIL